MRSCRYSGSVARNGHRTQLPVVSDHRYSPQNTRVFVLHMKRLLRSCRRSSTNYRRDAGSDDLRFGQTYSGRAYRDAIAAAHAHRIPVFWQAWNALVSGDGVSLNVLAPSLPFLADTGDDVNENSIVVMLHYRDFHELFMGDGRRSERSSTTRAGRRPSSGGRESRPSRIALRLDARIHRRSPPSDRDHLSRPTQYVRSSSAEDHRSVASFRRRNLAYDQCGAILYGDRDSPTTTVRCLADGS